MGIRLATKAYEPSLMPRSAIDQGLVAGCSFLTGFTAGATVSFAFDLLPLKATGPLLRTAGIVTAGSRTAHLLSLDNPAADPPDTKQGAWTDIGTEVVAGVALSRVIMQPGARIATAGALAAFGVSTASDVSTAVSKLANKPDAKYLATSAVVALASNLALAGVIGVVRLGGWIPSRAVRSKPRAAFAVQAIGSAATAAALGLAARRGASRLLGRIAASNRATEIAYDHIPTSSLVSGGGDSLVPFESLGVQGRRLVSEVVTSQDIEQVMGESARADAIRIYVGIDSASSEDELVDMAIAELDRAGAFERSTIVAASPSGTGYVNYITIEAAELMARGDCATVAIQYGSLPSLMSIDKIPKASRIHGNLLTRIRAEIDERGSSAALVAFGESLGAITGQSGVEAASTGPNLIVDRALWVGTPPGSPLFERMTSEGTPVFDHPSELAAYVESHAVPSVVFLNHANDPVTKFAVDDLHTMPDWLAEPNRGRGTNPDQRWLPGVAFFQGLIDTKNAATVVPGEFLSSGHDYRADLAQFVKTAYGFDDVSEGQMNHIEDRLRDSEVERSAGIELGTVQHS